MNKFNNFFNKFFGKKKTEEPKQETPKTPKEGFRRGPIDESMIDSIMGTMKLMKELQESKGDPSKTLGPPDRIEYSERDGLYFRDQVWVQNGGHGEIHSQEMSDVPFDQSDATQAPKEMTLEDKLAKALKDEDYEMAATLRDEINKK